ncbi:MAG TPA: hypothetical protein VML54_15860, partial [Candidatus Limnocylindrales bacterium]|nr:hypothetical protein [Candidatus Limnocylindrales bacterium]
LGLREANTDVGVTLPRFSASVGTRFNDVSSLGFVHADVAARITEYLDGRASTSWDTRRGVAVEHRVGVNVHYQCWAFTIEYVDRHRDEDEVRFSINLLGLGQLGTRTGTGIR